ncbi:peptidylprolyl isomerase [Robiginitalea aurantiaca]|uniref:Peptidyl-prolyl cis-trans isomerase n=1 Tax=Robiginitalea aurantiaca TaxID=3056915 RepID=A0ABT7WHM5_9FLAO|nr:peptidylprolyl isomerase [Robiginitalea aurantiaca]MDM9632419.1 peptidylprolyl isomerase [Robiginitalea aurantiaca]
MSVNKPVMLFLISALLLMGCREQSNEKLPKKGSNASQEDSLIQEADALEAGVETDTTTFLLTEENAIDFFYNYQQDLKANKVRLTTSMGSFTVELFDNVPYHKSNFIYLTRKGYFDNTMFHRVVKDFIIQGGNADNQETARKRREIGRYLLPPDTRKGHKHHRGTISMPSSEIDNPHMLASPFEFFIVVTDPGSYHLDGAYTAFGTVIEGMEVVDRINQVPVDDGEWPMKNIFIEKAEVLD